MRHLVHSGSQRHTLEERTAPTVYFAVVMCHFTSAKSHFTAAKSLFTAAKSLFRSGKSPIEFFFSFLFCLKSCYVIGYQEVANLFLVFALFFPKIFFLKVKNIKVLAKKQAKTKNCHVNSYP